MLPGALDPLEYAKELKRQVEEREREKARAKAEQEAYDRKFEEEAASYNPWGRGGAGAPLKDAQVRSLIALCLIYNLSEYNYHFTFCF